jgi:hypothetical protein
MLPRLFVPVFVVTVAALSFGCAPKIGDECETSVDCSQGGERLCDITQPGGYCTVFNCEPDSCPDESVCIAFAAQPSARPDCRIADGLSRFSRSFCMASCSSNSDCRSGYQCIDVNTEDNGWGAVLLDDDESGKVCIVPASTVELTVDDEEHPEVNSEVCSPDTSDGAETGGSGGMSNSSGGTDSGGGTSGSDSSGGIGGD